MANTIKIKKYVDIVEQYPAHDANIVPGHLLKLLSTGKVDGHADEEGVAVPMFALEDELQGKTIDDKYATDAPVQVWIPQRGEQVLAVLKDDENVAVGDYLVSAGTGELQKKKPLESLDSWETETRDSIVAQALEAVDLSDSSGAWSPTAHERRIKVRIV